MVKSKKSSTEVSKNADAAATATTEQPIAVTKQPTAGVPRICVLSSGLDRFHKPCSDIFKKQISLSQYPIDFYGMFWQPVNNEKLNDHAQGFRQSTIWTAPQRPFEDLPNLNKPPETNIKNFFSMAWGKWLLGNQMTIDGIWDQYDIFLYCRPDVCFDNSIYLPAIMEHLQSYDIFFPNNGHWRDGVNDQIAFGGRKMEVYLNLFQEILNYITQGIVVHPETMLKHHLLSHGLRIAQYPIQNYIFRDETRFHVG